MRIKLVNEICMESVSVVFVIVRGVKMVVVNVRDVRGKIVKVKIVKGKFVNMKNVKIKFVNMKMLLPGRLSRRKLSVGKIVKGSFDIHPVKWMLLLFFESYLQPERANQPYGSPLVTGRGVARWFG